MITGRGGVAILISNQKNRAADCRQPDEQKHKIVLTTAARSAAVLALITTPVTRHHAAALRAHRSIRRHSRRKRKFLLRTYLSRSQSRRFPGFIRIRILSPQELRSQPPENIIRNRFCIRNRLVARP